MQSIFRLLPQVESEMEEELQQHLCWEQRLYRWELHLFVTEEAQVHQNYKDKILKASDIDTRVTGRTTGHPVRALRNEMTKKYLKMEQEGAPFEELELMTLGGLRKAVVDGDVKTGSVMSGQIAGLVNEQMSCQALIQKLVRETDALIGTLNLYETEV